MGALVRNGRRAHGPAVTRRLAWEKRRAWCAVCDGPIFQRYDGGPWVHVNLADWSPSPHEARPITEPTEPDTDTDPGGTE